MLNTCAYSKGIRRLCDSSYGSCDLRRMRHRGGAAGQCRCRVRLSALLMPMLLPLLQLLRLLRVVPLPAGDSSAGGQRP